MCSVQVCQSVTGFPSLSVNVPQAIMIRSTSAPMPKHPAVSSQSTPDLADVEAVDAETADKDAQQQRDQARFRAGVRVDAALGLHGAAALRADNGLIDQLRAALSTVFHGFCPPSRQPPQRPRFLSYDKRSVAFSAPVVNFPAIYIRSRKAQKRGSRVTGFLFSFCVMPRG